MHPNKLAGTPRNLRTLLGALAFLGAVAGCGSGDRPLDEVDPNAAPIHPTYEQVFAIVDRSCVPCHRAGSARVTRIDDCSSIVALRTSIVQDVDDNTMPPGVWPRLTSEEKLTIRRWVEDGTPAPCNP